MTAPLFLAGPTAVGKSEIALALAAKIGGEIISVDSMQVYRGLDIGTAKPDVATQKSIRHHLIDVCDLSEPFDAAKFVQLANLAVIEIQTRNHVPIFCGGTGLYFKAFLNGIGAAPAADPQLRAELEAIPLPQLLEELRERDPDAYAKIDQANPRRVIRAIEIVRTTNKPVAASQADWAGDNQSATRKTITVFARSGGDLLQRIDSRVDEMFRRGLVEETRELLERGLGKNQTAMQAIGYRQVVEHLRGGRDLDQTVELVKIRTRQFAKRQLTWFRRHAHCKWIELKPAETVEGIMARLSH
ncbi:MAG TPA: tRNA (adenosine(37)-N6)-dimethylallyltransferase MiaA [Alphaproteobacteria bacterium]|nr:tRNA (adenosine(37)-N6)-dimethylallyltransferase MiaA [Alphaproteobacteria bacterium]